MKTKLIYILVAFAMLDQNAARSEGLGLPSAATLEQQALSSGAAYKGTHPSDVVFDESDFDAPSPGQVMIADWKRLQSVNQIVAGLLSSAPDDETGKQSAWYGQLQTWKGSFDQFVSSKSQANLFALIPTMAAYVGREDGSRTLAPQLEQIEDQMRGMGYYVIRAMGNHVTEQQATVAQATVNKFASVFALSGFVDEGAWEDETMPINSSGVMILDASAVVTQLKAEPWQQAKQFLGGATTASGFFARYTGSGDGLPVLKTKYAANQSTIDAKFNELKTWADQQEQQAEGGN
jgi:hypothetical protein